MADSNFRGPINSMGALEVNAATVSVEPLDGPSSSYQGYTVPDLRTAPFAKDGFRPGQQAGVLLLNDMYAVDMVPQAAATGALAASQVMTASLAFTLATVAVNAFSSGAASIGVGIPIIPQGTTVATTVIALDFGFTTGTTVAGSTAVVVADNTLLKLGQWVVVSGAGNSAGTAALIAQVAAIATANTTGINLSAAAATGISNAPIGQGNLMGGAQLALGTQFGPTTASANAHIPYMEAGLMRVVNPREMSSRVISLSGTGGTTTVTASIIVNGYDVWGAAMSELITVNALVTTVFGKKAFKYVRSVVGQTSVATAYVVGIGDVFGMPYRMDETEQVQVSWGGTTVPNNVGYSTAVTSAATNTTGDVRGTVQVSTSGLGTPVTGAATTNNVRRLVIVQNVGVWNSIYATPINLAPMYGTAQI